MRSRLGRDILHVLLGMLLVASCAFNAVAEPAGQTVELSAGFKTGDRFMQTRLLGALRIAAAPVNGFAATELSGIAWNDDDEVLYAISDGGHLVHLRPHFSGGTLTGIELLGAHPLLDSNGSNLLTRLRDAEGLAILNGRNHVAGDALLLVSFEGAPRIDVYKPNGGFVRRTVLPRALRRSDAYRCRNCQLEAVTVHPDLGVVTAPQLPLRGTPGNLHDLFDERGRVWSFPPMAADHCAIVGLETAPDGSLLVLERRYKNVFSPIVFTIRRVRADLANRPAGGALESEEIVRFDNTDGWMIDNFEGLAHHRGQRYFMVSDDNNSALQSTLLVYLEILPP